MTNQTAPTAISQAVAPLRDRAIEAAEIRQREYLDRVKKVLEDNDWDLIKVAPDPHSNMGRKAYIAAKDRHNFFSSITVYDEERTGVPRSRFFSFRAKQHFVKWNEEAAERSIEMAKRDAAASYDAYVVKLEKKVGAHTAATLRPLGSLWSYSFVDVTLPDGTVQCWKTQMILNHSSLGRLFNQWPTRVVKG